MVDQAWSPLGRWRTVTSWVLVAAAGFCAGFVVRGPVSATLSQPVPQAPSAQGATKREFSELTARLGRLEQLQTATLYACQGRSSDSSEETRPSAAAASAAENTPPLEAVEEVGSENVQALLEGQRIVESAITAGRWTERDRDELRAATAELGGERRTELLQALSRNVNEGRLRLDVNGPPF